MGWLRTIFLGDIGNRLDIGDNERRISDIRSTIRKGRNRDNVQDKAIAELQERCERLEILSTSLVQLLVQKQVLSEEELRMVVEAADEPGQE